MTGLLPINPQSCLDKLRLSGSETVCSINSTHMKWPVTHQMDNADSYCAPLRADGDGILVDPRIPARGYPNKNADDSGSRLKRWRGRRTGAAWTREAARAWRCAGAKKGLRRLQHPLLSDPRAGANPTAVDSAASGSSTSGSANNELSQQAGDQKQVAP